MSWLKRCQIVRSRRKHFSYWLQTGLQSVQLSRWGWQSSRWVKVPFVVVSQRGAQKIQNINKVQAHLMPQRSQLIKLSAQLPERFKVKSPDTRFSHWGWNNTFKASLFCRFVMQNTLTETINWNKPLTQTLLAPIQPQHCFELLPLSPPRGVKLGTFHL